MSHYICPLCTCWKAQKWVKKRLKQTRQDTEYSKVRHSAKDGTQLSPCCFALLVLPEILLGITGSFLLLAPALSASFTTYGHGIGSRAYMGDTEAAAKSCYRKDRGIEIHR